MTVCVAAVAHRYHPDRVCIVEISDKMLSYYSDGGYMAAESRTFFKRLSIAYFDDDGMHESGWDGLVSGDMGLAFKVGNRVADAITSNPAMRLTADGMMSAVEEAYQQERQAALIAKVLKPRLLTPELLWERDASMAPLPDDVAREVFRELNEFEFDLGLIVCGFDSLRQPHVFTIGGGELSAQTTDLVGCAVIGGGASVGLSRLLWAEFQQSAPLDQVLYEAFDAKAHAELIAGVGTEWDAWIRTPTGATPVPSGIKELLSQVFVAQTQSPFWPSEHKARPPKNWLKTLRAFTHSVFE